LFFIAANIVDEKKNLLNAASAYNEALKIFKIMTKLSGRNNLPVECASIQQNLGEVYSRLAKIEKNREDAISMAIESFYNALEIYNINTHPSEYADIQTQIGGMHLFMAGILQENNLKDVSYYIEYMKKRKTTKKSTAVRSTGAQGRKIEKTKGHIVDKEEETRKENLSHAINAYNEALKVYTLEEQPMEYAVTQNNLGMSYCVLAGITKEEEDFYNAIEAYNEALKVYTLEEQPMEYAVTCTNLAIAYSLLSELSNREENLANAIEAYNEALKVYTLEEQPMEYATTQNNLGMLYWMIAELADRRGNLINAINAYNEALKVYTLKEYPSEYGSINKNLGKMHFPHLCVSPHILRDGFLECKYSEICDMIRWRWRVHHHLL